MRANRFLVCFVLFMGLCCYPEAGIAAAGQTAAASQDGAAEEAAASQDHPVSPADPADLTDSMLSDLDLDSITRFLRGTDEMRGFDFRKMLKEALSGDYTALWQYIRDAASSALFSDSDSFRKGYMYVILLAVMAAVFTNISSIFGEQQLSGTGFFLIYLSMAVIILQTFQICADSLKESLNHLMEFMQILAASFSITVGLSNGSGSASGIYMALLLGVWLIETVFVCILLPMVHLYMVMIILDHLSEEPFLGKFAELLKNGFGWIIKTVLGIVTGMNFVQGLIGPAADSLKRTVAGRTAEAIPGIGDALAGTANVIAGTAALIRNGIGVAGMLICILICLVPMIRFFTFMFLFRIGAAMLEPITDRRIADTLTGAGWGYGMLLHLTFGSGILFLISLAVVITIL